MPWTLKFWSQSPTPPAPVVMWSLIGARATPGDFPSGQNQVGAITTALNGIAGLSDIAHDRLDDFGQHIRIGYAAGVAGGADIWATDNFIVIDVVAANNFHFFNSFGKLVQGDLGLTLMHELAHIYLQKGDSPDGATDAMMDAREFKVRGEVIDEQNAIARDAGLTDQIQVAYLATTRAGTALHSLFTTNVSYTDGNEIDNARLDRAGANNMDHSLRTNMLRDLMFGLDGDDVMKAGKGRDYVYGGTDNDTLWGGDGNDVLVGEAGNDSFRGGKGNDLVWGGDKESTYQGSGDGTDVADYSQVRAAIEIGFDATTNKLTVEDGEGGTDTLASIEKIQGSARNDSFTFTGNGTGAKVDMTDVVDGYVLTTQNTYEVRVMGIETFIGGDARQMTRPGLITSMSSRETVRRSRRPIRGTGRPAHRRGWWRKSWRRLGPRLPCAARSSGSATNVTLWRASPIYAARPESASSCG